METLASAHYKLAFHGRFLQLARPCASLPSVREFSRRFTTMQQSTGSGSYPADWPYITAAFRCSSGNQAYIFKDEEYMLLKYDETMLDGGELYGPELIEEGIPSLAKTNFGYPGITGAFGVHGRNEAFIFAGNWGARIRYARDRSDFKILEGPMPIFRMFPCLDGTVFENYLGPAFESTKKDEAYLFYGNEYAVLNYKHRRLISHNQTFDCLKDTVFESNIDAAFASHVAGEAFIFKNDSYALFNFVDECIVGDVKKIPDCPTLGSVLPRWSASQITPDYFEYDESEYSCEEDIED